MKCLRLLLNGGICWWNKWAGQSGGTSAIHFQLTTSYVCHNCHSYKSYYKPQILKIDCYFLLFLFSLLAFSVGMSSSYSMCVPVRHLSATACCFGPALGNNVWELHCQVASQQMHCWKFIKIFSLVLFLICGEWMCSWEISELDEVYTTCWAAFGPEPAASCFSAGSFRWRQTR